MTDIAIHDQFVHAELLVGFQPIDHLRSGTDEQALAEFVFRLLERQRLDRPLGLTFSQKLQLSFGRNRMMLVWMGIIVWTVGLPAGIATAGAVGASEIAGTGVKKAWRLDTAAHVRHWFIGALSVIVLVAIIALWRVDESPRLIAFSSALVTSTVLLQRPVYIVLRTKFVDASRKAIYPFAVFTGLISNAINGSVKNATITQVAGTCMLFGVATVILSYLYQEVNSARTAASVNP